MKARIFVFKAMMVLLSAAFLDSCVEDTTIPTTDSAYVPVIYGTITDQNIRQGIQITSSRGYFDKKENARIADALVVLCEDSAAIHRTYILTQDSVGSGVYMTRDEMRGRPGWTYSLQVKMDFNHDGTVETYTAESKMPKKVDLDSLAIEKIKEGDYTMYAVNISAVDPKDENYYFGKYSINGKLYNAISKYILFDDMSLNGQKIRGLTIHYFFDRTDKDQFSDDDAKDMIFMSSGDKITLQVSNINKDYWDFISDCINQENGSNPMFGGPATNISTNISNGARGFFTAYCVSSASATAPVE